MRRRYTAAQAKWGKYRARLMRSVNKRRWPVARVRIMELPGGDSIVRGSKGLTVRAVDVRVTRALRCGADS